MARALHIALLSRHLVLHRVCLEILADAYFEGGLSVVDFRLIRRVQTKNVMINRIIENYNKTIYLVCLVSLGPRYLL